jgi:hypothetical protein
MPDPIDMANFSDSFPSVNPELAAALISAVWQRDARRCARDEVRFTCPLPDHEDTHPSARWNPIKATWFCDVCGLGGGATDLAERLGLMVPTETVYEIKNTAGDVVALHVRIDRPGEQKVCVWKRPDGQPGLDGVPLETLPLFGTELLATAEPGARVVLVEGEKAAVALTRRGVLALGTCTGAKATPCDAVLATLAGFQVTLWPDADRVGRAHMARIAARLQALDVVVHMIDPWPTATDGEDAADFTGTAEELAALLERAAEPGVTSGRAWLRLADVEPEAVDWLWYGRIPLGKVTILEGDPDEGKSCITIDIAARVTTGRQMPKSVDPALDPAGVVYITAEDGLPNTVRPRFDAAGGDPARVIVFPPDDMPELNDAGLALIEAAVGDLGAKLVILDPLNAFLPDKVDTHKDHHVRRALKPMFALAARTGVAVLVIRHLTKATGGTNPKYRGGGSIGILGFARSGLLVAPDPDVEGQKVLSVHKHKLCPEQLSLSYQLVEAVVGPIATVKTEWLGVSPHRAADLLVPPESPEERTKTEEAAEFLRVVLAACPLPSSEVLKAAHQAGIAERTLQRARLKVATTEKSGMGGGWTWALKGSRPVAPSVETAPSVNVAPSAASSANLASSVTSEGAEDAKEPEDAKVSKAEEAAPSAEEAAPSRGGRVIDL